MGRLRKGDKPKKQFNYKFPEPYRKLMNTARNIKEHETETDFVIDAIKEKATKKLGKKEVIKILNEST